MSSSPHIDKKGKDILILGKGPTQGLSENSLTAEKMYSINVTVTKKKFCLNLHYNGANSYLFVNGKEIIKFKAKDSIVAGPSSNMKKTGLNSYVYEFKVDYSNNNTKDTIPYVHKYLMSKYKYLV